MQNIVLVEHFQRSAITQAQKSCKLQDGKCPELDSQIKELLDDSVEKAVLDAGIDCDPPCDWPDTLMMAILPEHTIKENSDKLMFFFCDPPCDWPDTISSQSKVFDAQIGYTKLPGQHYEFSLVDPDGGTIAVSETSKETGKKSIQAGQLVKDGFQVVKPDYSGDAYLIMNRLSTTSEEKQQYRIFTRVYNKRSN